MATDTGAYTATAPSLILAAAHHRLEVTALATITPPTVSGITGREYIVINCHTAAITVQGNGTEVIANGKLGNQHVLGSTWGVGPVRG